MGTLIHPAYSDLKSAWHLDRIAELRAGKPVIPVELQLIISDYCNQSCSWCAYRAEDGLSSELFGTTDSDGKHEINPKRFITYLKAASILHDGRAAGIRSVIFTGGGEPTAHPEHMTLFEYALDLGYAVSLNTNGAVFRDGWKRVLPRMAYVRFSIDAATPEEYARTRSVKTHVYAKVLANLADLVRAARDAGYDCVVGAGYVVTPENYAGLMDGVRNIRETGAAYVRIASMQSKSGRDAFGDKWNLARMVVSAVKEDMETDSFKVVDLFDSAMGQRMTEPFCGFQHLVHYVGADLKVYRCCYTAYATGGEVGDLTNQSYGTYLGALTRAMRDDKFDARGCPVCPMKGKNALIAYMADPAPLHVDFV